MNPVEVEVTTQQEESTSTTARVIYGNAENFSRAREPNEFHYERPLMVNAWAQTTLEDFGLINHLHQQETLELQRDIDVLREKVQSLEGDLRVHVELLNQIHATAALKPGMQRTSIEQVITTPLPTPSLPQLHNPQQQHQQQEQQHQRPRHLVTQNGTMYTQSSQVIVPQVINTVQVPVEHAQVPPTTDSFKYTIIGNNYEPIEIQLAEEDGAINLNNSADSTRLEICLSADEQQVPNKENIPRNKTRKYKKERKSVTPPPPLPPQSGMLVKRRKSNTNSAFPENQYNEFGAQRTPLSHLPTYYHQTADDSPATVKQEPGKQSAKRKSPINRITNKFLKGDTSPNMLIPQNDEDVKISIGPNNTRVPFQLYNTMTWDSASIATRKLLMAIFDRETLATHSMTGKPSPAFKGQSKPQKNRLDPTVIEDIIFIVTRRCRVSEKEVRNAVTTKCADENKMMKLSILKQNALRDQRNKENQNQEKSSDQDENQNQKHNVPNSL